MVVDEQAAAVRQQQLHQLLRDQLGDWDRALAGQDVILRYLAQLGVTTWSKRPPTWTTVRRWARWHGFPLLRGTKCGRNYFCSVTTQHAVTAWLVSRPANGYPMRVFRSPPPRRRFRCHPGPEVAQGDSRRAACEWPPPLPRRRPHGERATVPLASRRRVDPRAHVEPVHTPDTPPRTASAARPYDGTPAWRTGSLCDSNEASRPLGWGSPWNSVRESRYLGLCPKRNA